MIDFHPVLWMFDTLHFDVKYSYFNTGPIKEEVQGSYAKKIQGCMDCGFFWLVAEEEDDLTLSANGLCGTNRKCKIASNGKTSTSDVTSPDQ